MRTCIISDLHYKYSKLTAEDKENNALILSFLEQARGRYDILILNGDIFDLWYDWKYTIIKQYFPLLVKLYELRQAGCRIVHITGNHDFWFGDFLPDYLGVQLVAEALVFTADEKRIYVCHGDTHTVNDLRYQVFRRVIRLPLMKKIFGLLHPDFALGLGNMMSRSSRTRKDSSALRDRKNEGLRSYAKKLIKSGRADYVVMGHSHHPELIQFDTGAYANSGDWISHHSYVEIISGQIQIKHYDI